MRARLLIIAIAIACAGAVLAVNFFASDGYPRIKQLQSEVSRLQRDKSRLQTDVARLQQQLEALKAGGKYRQKIIRDELGYVRDDEVIVDLTKELK